MKIEDLFANIDIFRTDSHNTKNDNYIANQIKRTNRNLLLINSTILFATIIILIVLFQNGGLYEMGFGWLIFIGVIGCCSWNISSSFRRGKNPLLHPIFKIMKEYGPPNEIVSILDKEIKDSSVNVKDIIITKSWFIRQTVFGLDMFHLGDLVWAYKKVISKSAYGVPIGEDYSMIIYDKNGKSRVIEYSQRKLDEIMAALSERAPWIIFGYSKEIENLWNSDRKGFIVVVKDKQKAVKASQK